MYKAILLLATLFTAVIIAEDDPKVLREQGIAALSESQTNPDAVVTAATCFARASALFEKAGQEAEAQEVNSFLYWCKKKMNLQQIEAFTRGVPAPALTKPAPAVADPAAEAKAYFERAEAFAKAHPNDHLLVAIRFFEVADRFTTTEFGLKAQRLSLAEMQAAAAEQAKQPRPPAQADQAVRAPSVKPDVASRHEAGARYYAPSALEPLPPWPPVPAELSKLSPDTQAALPTAGVIAEMKDGNRTAFKDGLKKIKAKPESWTKEDFKARFDGWRHLNEAQSTWATLGEKYQAFRYFQNEYVLAAKTLAEFIERVEQTDFHKINDKSYGVLVPFADKHPGLVADQAARDAFCDDLVKLEWLDEETARKFKKYGLTSKAPPPPVLSAVKAVPTPAELVALEKDHDQAIDLFKRVAAHPESWTAADFDARWEAVKEIGRISNRWYIARFASKDVGKAAADPKILPVQLLAISHGFASNWVAAASTKEELLKRVKSLKQQDAAKDSKEGAYSILSQFVKNNAPDYPDEKSKKSLYEWLDVQKSGLNTDRARRATER